mmetsp:Transcript_49810/g.125225  ORF Transcript_49810/g.125225 Transcript_49810/m.125225 type:complete len:122 (-) Transcript_49810:26-391(-)|eukprot:CAMPEP_0177671370 /NCGR_PEP_ID=MMETSP0447-20121125/24662_1 /TAXON_ID=0 /ORGANISM="Stygamoeba regulata, Strain BSH-02190019" /LENGTH=121 /DNA_ID=CAMNT_0019178747 /DNA_START=201 /DNA_END=569 /DNA_ORIENTATION=+
MTQVLAQAFPSATLQQNPAGRPRKGSFEVTLLLSSDEDQTAEKDTSGVLLFSKLDTYGPAKNRAHLPNPVGFMETIKAALASKDTQNNTTKKVDREEEDEEGKEEEAEEKEEMKQRTTSAY